jgi:uncharacterized membrane protein YkoI
MSLVSAANGRARMRIAVTLAAVLISIFLALQHGALGKDRKSDCTRDQDCALNALNSGEIRPLPEVLAIARDKLPGEVVKIELERDDGIWVYEIKVLIPSGKRRKIEINARTLAVIKID